jgi:hypothetical protein
MAPETGRALWRCLHAFAFVYPAEASEEDQKRALAWLEWFSKAVDEASSNGCTCARSWRALLAEDPPKLRGAVEFFEWTVKLHNEVNAKLGKPLFCYP